MEKKQIYENLLVQLRGLVDGEHHRVSVMANATALLLRHGTSFMHTGLLTCRSRPRRVNRPVAGSML